MSRRISFNCSIRDKELAISALTALKCDYKDAGTKLHITSGRLNRATIDLETGEVVSDSDYHKRDELGDLRQAYSEAEFRRQAFRQGATIESRTEQNGVIKMLCRMTG